MTRRSTAAAAAALAVLGGIPAAAAAGTATATVHVTLRVTAGCTIGTEKPPAVDATGKPALPLEAVLSGCSDRDVPAELTIAADSAVGGSYVATVDF